MWNVSMVGAVAAAAAAGLCQGSSWGMEAYKATMVSYTLQHTCTIYLTTYFTAVIISSLNSVCSCLTHY